MGHEVQLAPQRTRKGLHTVGLNLADLLNDLYGVPNRDVTRVIQGGMVPDINAVSLVDGCIYMLSFRCQDEFKNPPKVVDITGIRFSLDSGTEPIILYSPL